MDKGWVNVHISFFEEPVWTEATPEQKSVMMSVILQANEQEEEVRWNGEMRLIQPWQLVVSNRQLADFVSPRFAINKAQTVLKKLAATGFLTYESNGNHILITVIQRDTFEFEPTNVLAVL